MDVNKAAEKQRHAAEREHSSTKGNTTERRKADIEGTEAHGELTRPDLAKGRPPAKGEITGERRPSNAGTDGP